MKAKLASGIKLKDYVVSYGNRPNDFENTSSCEFIFHSTAWYGLDTLDSSDLAKKFGRQQSALTTFPVLMPCSSVAGILKENSPVPRVFHCHMTSVIV